MAINFRNGWTSGSISHNSDLHDQALATLAPTQYASPATSDVGSVNGLAQLPMTAADLLASPSDIHDPKLASAPYGNPGTGFRDAPIISSVYQTNNVPGFLQQSIANLNAEQALKRSLQSELVNRIVGGMQGGGPNAYLWTEALRSAAVNPGAHVSFNAAVQNPLIGQGYNTAANAYAGKTTQQTQALSAANRAGAAIPELEQQRAKLGSVVMGGYTGSAQQKLDHQISGAYEAASPNSSTQRLARSVSGPNSGWFPTLPTY